MNKIPTSFIKDLSNNQVFNKKYTNIKQNTDKIFLQNSSINKNDLNNNISTFTMKIKKLLDDLQNERNKMHTKYLQIEDKKSTNKNEFDQ